jgi:hypothetical protein
MAKSAGDKAAQTQELTLLPGLMEGASMAWVPLSSTGLSLGG